MGVYPDRWETTESGEGRGNKNSQKKLRTPGNLGCKITEENVVYSWQGTLVCGQGSLVAWDLRESHYGP